jgi:hypothetical protein
VYSVFGKILAIAQYVIKYDYRERETTKNILLLTPFMAFLLTIFLRLAFFFGEPRQRNTENTS